MTAMAIIDFDGVVFAEHGLHEPGVQDGLVNASSFMDMWGDDGRFQEDLAPPDMNGDGLEDLQDALLAKDMILERVRQYFSPYDLNIVEGNFEQYSDNITDNSTGDVIVLVTGGFADEISSRARRDAFGLAPHYDLGNERDEIVGVFGQAIANQGGGPTSFVNYAAHTIAQEMGHAFGLAHVVSADGIAEVENHIMGAARSSITNFPDVNLNTDLSTQGGFRTLESEENPQFNPLPDTINRQNAHRYLSHPDVLGPSKQPWVATLRPGELTIHGSDSRDIIRVSESSTDLSTTISTQHSVTSSNGFTYRYYVSRAWDIDKVTSRESVVNPYEIRINRIKVFAKGGNDYVAMDANVTQMVFAWGDSGNDTIIGGSGRNYLWGGSDNDSLYGRSSPDYLDGDSGNDRLYGGGGNDTLFGDRGVDYLYGQSGNDQLYGGTRRGDDGSVDYLYGGSGRDIFYAKSLTSREDKFGDLESIDYIYDYYGRMLNSGKVSLK